MGRFESFATIGSSGLMETTLRDTLAVSLIQQPLSTAPAILNLLLVKQLPGVSEEVFALGQLRRHGVHELSYLLRQFRLP